MSCDVELVKEAYDDAMFMPVQCVVRVDGLPRVYVNDDGKWVPRIVRVGLDNNRMIHVLEGVQPGDEVMLAPPVRDQKKEEETASQAERPPVKNGKDGKPSGAKENVGQAKERKEIPDPEDGKKE
jgi:HlyD family secretion protein